MQEFLLALCILAAFALGHLPMKRLDRFLERNREAIEAERGGCANPPAETRGERARRSRSFGQRFPLPGSWRGGSLFPLRHRS